MTKTDHKIACAANTILWLWHQDIQGAERDPWYKHEALQAYHDSIRSMVFCGLIEDYDVVKIRVKIKGEWSSARRVTENK